MTRTSLTVRNQRSAEAKAYRAIYRTTRWKRLRLAILSAEPLCRMCKEADRLTPATVVDHITPHKGDLTLAYDPDNLQPLCKLHHDSAKQSEERRGYSRAVDEKGYPIDPRHPCNSGRIS